MPIQKKTAPVKTGPKEILNSKRAPRLLHDKRLDRGKAVISKHAIDRMEQRGINRASMQAAVRYGSRETLHGHKRFSTQLFLMCPSQVNKWKRKGKDLSWAMGVMVVVRDGTCVTTYRDEESIENYLPPQRLLGGEGRPFRWARIKNSFFAFKNWDSQLAA